jgi:hypothetical protein
MGLFSAMAGGGRGVQAGLGALATVFGEVVDQTIHLRELGPVYEVAPISLLADQASPHQFFEVKRKRGVGHPQVFTQLPWRGPTLPRYHQGTEHLQTVGLGQCGQGFDNTFFFHISILIKIQKKYKACFGNTPKNQRDEKWHFFKLNRPG